MKYNKLFIKIIRISSFIYLLSSSRACAAFDDLNHTLNWFLTGKDSNDPNNMANVGLERVMFVIKQVTNYALNIAGVLVFIMILYSAFMYTTAFGEESKAEAAKKALTWSIVGMIVIIFFKVIMMFVNTTLKTSV